MSNATADLLKKLHWPEAHLEEKGKVSWTRQGEGASTDAAIVLVSPSQIRARMTRFWPDGPDPMHMEAIWDIGADKDPALSSFAYAGEAQALNEGVAIQRFEEILAMINARPAFQTMGIRWKDQAAKSSLGM